MGLLAHQEEFGPLDGKIVSGALSIPYPHFRGVPPLFSPRLYQRKSMLLLVYQHLTTRLNMSPLVSCYTVIPVYQVLT